MGRFSVYGSFNEQGKKEVLGALSGEYELQDISPTDPSYVFVDIVEADTAKAAIAIVTDREGGTDVEPTMEVPC